jgi:predicted RNA polymerase sigma factor
VTSISPRTRCRTPSSARRALAARRSAAQSRRLDRHDGAQRGNRPDPREQTLARKTELLARAEELPDDEEAVIPDERLELIFACCHPASRRKRRSR